MRWFSSLFLDIPCGSGWDYPSQFLRQKPRRTAIHYSASAPFGSLPSMDPKLLVDGLILYLGLPLLMIFLSLSGSGLSRFLVGWAKPVPVNLYNLRNRRVDDILVTLAGPWMNLLLAIVIMGLARVGLIANYEGMVQVCLQMAHLSLLLCFFNLLPIPPLDGAQVVRSLIGMTYEAYYQFARYGFIILIIVIQIPIVQHTLRTVTNNSWAIIANWFGVPLP